jgi:hypothetical protein
MVQTLQERPATLSEAEFRELTDELRSRQDPSLDFLPSPERVAEEIASMFALRPSAELLRWAEGYGRVGRRNPYLWTWCRRAVELTTLPCVAPEWRDELCDTKALGVMWDVMLDDVADQGGDADLLEELLSVAEGRRDGDFARFTPAQREYASFTCDLWREIMGRAERYRRYPEFADLLRYDYSQLANVMRYSHLLNGNPELLNLTEHDLYTPHNMHIMICSTFDLMCSPGFDRRELGRLRELVWNAQCMGRIGNLVTTWQRELHEGDFTSGVYARAVSVGDLSVERLRTGDRTEIEAAILRGGHERYFLRRWRKHRQFLLTRGADLRSFDVRPYVEGFERLICLHLGSRGRK